MTAPDIGTLTPAGLAYARKGANRDTPSMICLVALQAHTASIGGKSCDWPAGFQRTAIQMCNVGGERENV